ncbi:MAG: tetratricopeptide repeat protein [Myxococcales bacterium]|nr:tetratricopeptide repeat protein [Myxococcales bacterium]
MKIICPKCGADYNINDSKIPPDGLHIKCPKCLHSFVATKDGGPAGPGTTPTGPGATGGQRPPTAPHSTIGMGGAQIQTQQGMPARAPVASPPGPPPPLVKAPPQGETRPPMASAPPAPPPRAVTGGMPVAPPFVSVPRAPEAAVDLLDEIEELDEAASAALTEPVFVKLVDQRTIGPYSFADLHVLLERGRLTGRETASADQRSWLPLSAYTELIASAAASAQPPAPPPPPPPPPPPAPPPRKAPLPGSGDFDFGFTDAPKTQGGAEADDFDFSFSDIAAPSKSTLIPAPAPPRPPTRPVAQVPPTTRPASSASSVVSGLRDLFDDLPDDLPAPKASGPISGFLKPDDAELPAPRGITDLPAPKNAGIGLPGLKVVADLPGLRGAIDLPGLRDEVGLPGLRDEVGLPGLRDVGGLPGLRGTGGLPRVREESGLSGLRDRAGSGASMGGELPSLPDDESAHRFAAGIADEVEGDSRPASTGDSSRKRKLMIGGGIAVAALLLGSVGAFIDGVGPFGVDLLFGDTPTDSSSPGPRIPKSAAEPSSVAAISTQPTSGAVDPPSQPGSEVAVLLPAGDATLAEVAGYRAEIGKRETQGEPTGAAAMELAELYAFGALEFKGNNEWARRAAELTSGFDAPMKTTLPGKRARIVAGIANSDGAALNEAIALAKANEKDARSQYLAGHALLIKADLDGAFAAFERGRALAPDLLPNARLSGETALRRGDLESARKVLEGVYKMAPGTPSVAVAIAAIEHRSGSAQRALKLVEQVLSLDQSRIAPLDRSAALMLRARLELERGDEDAGFATLDEAIRVYGENIEAVEMLSQRHFANKNFDKALTQFETLRAQGVSNPEIVINIAKCHEGLGSAEKAREELEKGAVTYPTSPVLAAAIGDAYLRARRPIDARAAYERALVVDPQFETAYLRIADLLVSQAKIGDASDFLKRALVSRPSSAMLHFGFGDLQMRLAGSNKDDLLVAAAEREFREAVKLEPTMLKARHRLAQALLEKGDAGPALVEFLALQKRPDYHEDLAYDVGRAQFAQGKIDDAIKSFEDARTRGKESPEVLLHAGIAYFAKGDYATANERFTLSAQIANKLTASHFYLGRVAYAQKNFKLATQKFQLASDEESTNLEFRYWLARGLLDEQQTKQAYQEFGQTIAGMKTNPKASVALCDTYYQHGMVRFSGKLGKGSDWRGAQGDFRSALDCDSRRADVWAAYADTFALNQEDTAIQHYSKSLAVDPTFARAYAERGSLLNRKGETNKAKADFEAAIRLDKQIANPHFELCLIHNSNGARGPTETHCKAYLALAPTGDKSASAQEILDDLNRSKK